MNDENPILWDVQVKNGENKCPLSVQGSIDSMNFRSAPLQASSHQGVTSRLHARFKLQASRPPINDLRHKRFSLSRSRPCLLGANEREGGILTPLAG